MKADADLVTAKAVAQELAQPVTTHFIDQPDRCFRKWQGAAHKAGATMERGVVLVGL